MTQSSEQVASTDQTTSIPVREGLTYDEFANEFMYPLRPVVLKNALKDWKAIKKWTPQFFRENYSTKKLTIDDREYLMEPFIDLVEQSGPDRIAPYLRNQTVKEVFPELMADLHPTPSYVLPNWLRGPLYPTKGREAEIYIGGAGAGFPFLHYDLNGTHAFLGQVYGEKEAILYSPDDTKYLYAKADVPRRRHHSYISDVENPDLNEFPLFAKAVTHRGLLTPGSLLFIPSRWWHTARMLTSSITVSYNVANRSNWHNVCDEIHYKARCTFTPAELPLRLYMSALGRAQGLCDRMGQKSA
jgi:histone arginine demethylase JMJD6